MVQSYVAGDKIYCVYNAPSEALIKEHAQRSGSRQPHHAGGRGDRPDHGRRIALKRASALAVLATTH